MVIPYSESNMSTNVANTSGCMLYEYVNHAATSGMYMTEGNVIWPLINILSLCFARGRYYEYAPVILLMAMMYITSCITSLIEYRYYKEGKHGIGLNVF